MKDLLKSPIFWIGAVIGVKWLYTNKPDSKLTNVFRELEEGATDFAYQTADYASNVISTGAETFDDSLGALGWNMEDSDSLPPDPDNDGVQTTGGTTGLPDDDTSTTPGDDVSGGAPFSGRRNALPTHSNFNHLDFSSSEQGDVDLQGISKSQGSAMSEWDDDAEGSGNTNTGTSGVGAFTPESAVDTASERVQFQDVTGSMSFNNFDY